MTKVGLSLALGIVTLGWLSIIYAIAFDYLYFWLPTADVVDYCSQYFDRNGACRGVAYVSLWIMESPLLIATFFSIGLVAYLIAQYALSVELLKRYVVLSYLGSYLIYINFGPYGEAVGFWYNLGASIFHG